MADILWVSHEEKAFPTYNEVADCTKLSRCFIWNQVFCSQIYPAETEFRVWRRPLWGSAAAFDCCITARIQVCIVYSRSMELSQQKVLGYDSSLCWFADARLSFTHAGMSQIWTHTGQRIAQEIAEELNENRKESRNKATQCDTMEFLSAMTSRDQGVLHEIGRKEFLT